MALNDKAEAVKDVGEKEQEHVERTLAEAHSEKALSALLDKKTGDFLSQKTNIDQAKVGDKTVDLNDGKHEREKSAIKDAAQAMAKGDVHALEKVLKGLSREQAKTVAAGLDKALKPGARVSYDGDYNTIDIHTNPPSLTDSRSHKIMIPTSGDAPIRGVQQSRYEDGGAKATGEDFKKIIGDAVKGDAARNDTFGLTMNALKLSGSLRDSQFSDHAAATSHATRKAEISDEPYLGEGIQREISTGTQEVEKGDTLRKIAREALPEGTSQEIKKYEREIARINHLDPGKPLVEGQTLRLPGHDADGNILTIDSAGMSRKVFSNGREQVESADGERGYVREPDGLGGYVEEHWGKRAGDNFVVRKESDGRIYVSDAKGVREVPELGEEVRREHEALERLAKEKISDPEQQEKFLANMRRFELRAAEQTPPLPPEEVAQAYREVTRLLEAQDNKEMPHLKAADRVNIAAQVMSQAASPTTIDQGSHDTCNVATVEARTYTRSPAQAAKLIADVATTGKYLSPEGKQYSIDPRSLMADKEASDHPPADGDRSHASQIFQVTAVNVYWASHEYTYKDKDGNEKHVPPGKLEYQQRWPDSGAKPPDDGERLVDNSTSPPTIISDWNKERERKVSSPKLPDDAIVEISNKITGKDDTIYLGHSGELAGEGKMVQKFNKEEEMQDLIAQAKREGKLPIIVRVHSGNEPFLHDSGGGRAGGAGGWHVVTITDYDGTTGRVSYDNQWGSSSDHEGRQSVEMHELYLATRAPYYKELEVEIDQTWYGKLTLETEEVGGTYYDLVKEVNQNRQDHSIDFYKEFELLRLGLQNNRIHPERYDLDLQQTIMWAQMTWLTALREHQEAQAKGIDDSKQWERQKAAHDKSMQKLTDMISAMPPIHQSKYLQLTVSMVPPGQYDKMVVEGVVNVMVGMSNDGKERNYNADDKRWYVDKLSKLLDSLPQDRQDGIRRDLIKELKDIGTNDALEFAALAYDKGVLSNPQYGELIYKTAESFFDALDENSDLEDHVKEKLRKQYQSKFDRMLRRLPEDEEDAVRERIKEHREFLE